MCCIDSTWESKEIKSNITANPTQTGVTADFKYLIHIPKQELNNDNIPKDGGNKRWNDKYQEFDEDNSDDDDDDEDIIILRCQTRICQDGNKCIPMEYDFVVRVKYGYENSTPSAADANFSYKLPNTSSSNNSLPKACSKIDTSTSISNNSVET